MFIKEAFHCAFRFACEKCGRKQEVSCSRIIVPKITSSCKCKCNRQLIVSKFEFFQV